MKRRVSLEILCVDLPWVGLEGRRTVTSLFQENVSAFCLISSSLFYSPKGGGGVRLFQAMFMCYLFSHNNISAKMNDKLGNLRLSTFLSLTKSCSAV